MAHAVCCYHVVQHHILLKLEKHNKLNTFLLLAFPPKMVKTMFESPVSTISSLLLVLVWLTFLMVYNEVAIEMTDMKMMAVA